MAKAIYTKVDGNYYKVIQDTSNPKVIFSLPDTYASMTVDEIQRHAISSIWINPVSGNTCQTNKEAANDMISFLKANKVQSMLNIQNRFVVYIDYSIWNENGTEQAHSVLTKELEPIDCIVPFGVGQDNELIYKQVKEFDTQVTFTNKVNYPFGIMQNTAKAKYILKINDISIYQDLLNGSSFVDKHYSCMENVYAFGSHTIASTIENMKKIYSTYDEGMGLSAMELYFVPRNITLNLHMACDNVIVLYDDNQVNDILIANIREAGGTYVDPNCPCYHCPNCNRPEEEPVEPEEPEIPSIPAKPVTEEGEKFPTADGAIYPYEDNTYDYFMVAHSGDDGALLVVDDNMADDVYNNDTMIHKHVVIADIPTIQIGDYVTYRIFDASTEEG